MADDAPGRYTSLYLDRESSEKLVQLVEETGLSRSQIIRTLINGADGERDTRMTQLVTEMAELLQIKAPRGRSLRS